MTETAMGDDAERREIALRLTGARRRAEALPVYPGAVPSSLEVGYACQDAAIALWGRPVAGWKVGRIPDAWLARMGEERLVGPIFASALQAPLALAHDAAGLPVHEGVFEVIAGGFAAVEAEFVFGIDRDAPPGKTAWSDEDALAMIGSLHVGAELAGSPMPMINDLGPAVVVSDFGNNAGLILGPAVADWRAALRDDLHCRTLVEDVEVGHGRASGIAGGLVAALRFALARCAMRGMPLRAGQWVSTGAATGIHDVVAGQRARVVFDGIGEIAVTMRQARPEEGA
jgi:2-keto-4-pentenoate hydratase